MESPVTRRCRRRLVSLSMATSAALTVASGASLIGHVSGARRMATEPLVPIDAATLNSNIRHWTTDYAVMFYAPWCSHCKEMFMPMWQDVAAQLAAEDPRGKRKLLVGKFDCEQDTAAASFCQDVNLKYYPTFMFFGAGKFHDHDPVSGLVLEKPTQHDSSAKYPSTAMVYHEVMVSWVKTMHFISSSNRVISRSNIFGGNVKTSEARLAAEIEALERQNHLLQEALAGGAGVGGTDGAIQLPYGYGDPFKELWEVGYGEEFDPVMTCVVDMAVQYCDVEGIKEQDPWCATLESCIATEFRGDECWPSSCPLLKEGCQLTSFCLTPELIETYTELLQEEDAGANEQDSGELEYFGSTWEGTEGSMNTSPGVGMEQRGEAGVEEATGEQTGVPFPPFLGRRPAGSHAGVDRAGDERETVAA
ncbi:unnamed protein product [Ascophyllum nodosum]